MPEIKYPAFVVIYHHIPMRDIITYEGKFSNNLKVVYIKDDPNNIERVYGLNIVGYYCGRDVDQRIEELVKSRIR